MMGYDPAVEGLVALSEEEEEEDSVDSVIQDGLSNVLDVTGLRQTSEQTRLIDSDTSEEEQTDITAVRRAVEDDSNGAENLIDNADTDLLVQRSQIPKTRNFIADQRVDTVEESLKDVNKVILPRGQRNFEEAANNEHSVNGDNLSESNELENVSLNENEIFNDEDTETINSTNENTSEESRSGSGVNQGKKSIKILATTNDLKSARLKKPFQNTNIIEDSVKHKSVADLVKNLRKTQRSQQQCRH